MYKTFTNHECFVLPTPYRHFNGFCRLVRGSLTSRRYKWWTLSISTVKLKYTDIYWKSKMPDVESIQCICFMVSFRDVRASVKNCLNSILLWNYRTKLYIYLETKLLFWHYFRPNLMKPQRKLPCMTTYTHMSIFTYTNKNIADFVFTLKYIFV